jgi:hypothetical protein
MNAQQVSPAECQKVGEAFTHTLLRSAERDFSDTVVLGTRLVEELHKRGLMVAAIEPSPPAGQEAPK